MASNAPVSAPAFVLPVSQEEAGRMKPEVRQKLAPPAPFPSASSLERAIDAIRKVSDATAALGYIDPEDAAIALDLIALELALGHAVSRETVLRRAA